MNELLMACENSLLSLVFKEILAQALKSSVASLGVWGRGGLPP